MSDSARSTLARFFGFRTYMVAVTTAIGALALAAFTKANQKPHFNEIDVGRINVREPDGTLRMVISNRTQSQGPMFKGKPFGYPGGTRAGIIFFNDEGTEDGGLIWSGKTEKDGKYHAVGHLSFDQYNQDQVVTLSYAGQNGTSQKGLAIDDRANVPIDQQLEQVAAIRKLPDGPAKDSAMKAFAYNNGEPLHAQRLFVGADRSKASVVNLSDRLGNIRLRLVVDSLGTASIEFLGTDGKVTRRISATDAAQ